jgi:pleiotropic regulator 1
VLTLVLVFHVGSAGGNNIKKWKCPDGTFVFNFSGHNAIINTMSVNSEGVMFSGGEFLVLSLVLEERYLSVLCLSLYMRLPLSSSPSPPLPFSINIMDRTYLTLSPPGDNGTITFWDYNSGTAFQTMEDIPQPGSLEAEAGVFCSTFDVTGTRLITGCADKTIKVRRLFLLPCCCGFVNALFL